MNTNPPRHYGVGLLDDLHTFFPALLYEPERFGSVADVLAYVRDQTQRRFDLFSAGRQQYMASVGAGAGTAAAGPAGAPSLYGSRGHPLGAAVAPRAPVPPVAPPPTSPLQTPPQVTRQRIADRNGLLAAGELLNLMLSPPSTTPGIFDLLGGLTALETVQIPAGAMDPVIVRPTRAQIQAGSTLEVVDSDEEVCAICQDELAAGTEARNLTYCDHRFHPGCIDTWFQRDVHCPVCRHDIRELGIPLPAGAPAAGQN